MDNKVLETDKTGKPIQKSTGQSEIEQPSQVNQLQMSQGPNRMTTEGVDETGSLKLPKLEKVFANNSPAQFNSGLNINTTMPNASSQQIIDLSSPDKDEVKPAANQPSFQFESDTLMMVGEQDFSQKSGLGDNIYEPSLKKPKNSKKIVK